jgi:hypothetical protein
MPDPTRVPQLREHCSARIVDGVSDLAPGSDLRISVNAGGRWNADRLGGDIQSLGDDQTHRRTLLVVLLNQGASCAIGISSVAPHRRHDDAIFHGYRAERERL